MRTAFIAIVGRPNVGKSRLLNALTGEKIAIVSNKPQTTRNRITGILTEGEDQFVFMDTPGLLRPKNKLGDYMLGAINSTIAEVDAAILVVEANGKAGPAELSILERLKQKEIPCVLAVNKIDHFNGKEVGDTILAYQNLYDYASVVPVSAMTGKNVPILLEECKAFMHEDAWYYDEDDITDQPERQIAAEMIREKILRTCNEEIPHGIAVIVEDFKEEGKLLSIRATIYCERETHKAIIIGHNGEQLKKIGSYARADLEEFFGTKVYLNLWTKVKENWRDDLMSLNRFGFNQDDFK